MIVKELKVSNRTGLHTRPASLIAKTSSEFESSISLIKDDMEINGKSIMGILTLGCTYGDTVKMVCQGVDEIQQAQAIENLFSSRFERAYDKEEIK